MVVAASVPVRRVAPPRPDRPWPDESGEPAVRDPDGRPDLALCRCGRSATPPHCDRSHRRSPVPDDASGSVDPSIVAATSAAPGDVPGTRSGEGGPRSRTTPDAEVVDVPDGPRERSEVLVVDGGPLVVHGISLALPDGTRTNPTTVAVCRCGASRSHPWCDGLACGFALA